MINSLTKALFSTRLMAVLFVVFATAMALGTFVESWYSIQTARIWIITHGGLKELCCFS